MFKIPKPIAALPFLILIASAILSGFVYTAAALTGLLLLLWAGLAVKYTAASWPRYPLSYAMLTYLGWLIIVTTFSTIPNVSLLTMWTLAGLPLAYLAWTASPDTDAIWPYLRTLLWMSGICLAAWGLWQVIYHVGNGQAVGPLADRNAFAALMNLLWFPAAYLFLSSAATRQHWQQILLPVGLFIISMALFATASRGGIATWLLLLPVLLWAGYRHRRCWRLPVMLTLLALLAYLCSALFLHSSVAERSYQLTQDPSTHARLLLWQSALQMALAHPFSGTGWGTFAGYYPAYRSPLENTTAGDYAHNDYLQLAAEGGIPALLLQLGILFGLVFQLKHSLQRAADKAGLESTALLLGALAVFIHAGVNFIFYYAFMTILAGLYLARAAQLVESARPVTLPNISQISRPIKSLLVGFAVFILAAPLVLHLTAQLCLTGTQPGLKALHVLAPGTSAYDIAKFITAVRPQEGIAQEVMLQTVEQSLADSAGFSMSGGNFQRELLNEALERFDLVRAQTANNPNYGVREARLLIAYQASLDNGEAYRRAHQILSDNMQTNPYHANSMIELARLQVAEGHRSDALHTLQWAIHHILSRRDHQLLDVETLRQLAAPTIIPALDDIEKQLRQVRSESETGKALILAPHFSEDIDARLQAIAAQIQPTH